MQNVQTSNDAQLKRVIETARKIECDKDAAAFEKKLGKIAKAGPKAATNPPTK